MESDLPARGPPASFSVHLASSAVIPVGPVDKGDLFVLNWARVGRVRRGSISSELIMCDGGVHSIWLLPIVARCLETIDVCIWRMFVLIVVIVWVSVGMFFLCSGRC